MIISERNKDVVLAEIFLAQTKTVPHATDFKRLADLANRRIQGVVTVLELRVHE